MLENILSDLMMILPSIVLVIGAMLLLIWGAFADSKSPKYHQSVIVTTISVILVSIFALTSADFNGQIFEGLLVSNSFTYFSQFLIILSGLAIVLMMWPSKDIPATAFEIQVLILFSLAGMMIMVSANSLISLFISMEIMSLPLYVMAASDRSNSISTEAGMKYFILGSLSTGIFLFGASLVYGFTGTLSFTEIDQYFSNMNDGTSAIPIGFLVGLVFIIISFCFKISAVPFHMWTPDVYQGAPTIITAFMSSAPKVAGITLFLRLLLEPFYNLSDQWQQIVVFVSIASMFVGSLGAIMQTNFKRLLAYSSIGHIGFALVGLASSEDEGLVGVMLYMTIYLTMTLAVFASLLMVRKNGKPLEMISDLAGISKSHPTLAMIMAIIMLSMAGIPPLAGFFAKFYVLLPAVQKGMYGLAISAILASLIAAYYYLKIVKVMYFDELYEKNDKVSAFTLSGVALAGAVFNVLFIIAPSPIINIATKAVEVLFG